MMIDNNLPDLSSFALVKYVERTRRLPIVMMCDTEKTVGDGLLSGAMYCIIKPVRPADIEHLWQLPILKRRQNMVESPPVSFFQTNGPTMPESSNGSQNFKKRKMDEMQRSYDCFMGQPSPFVWTPDLNCKFPRVSQDLGISNASPSALACRFSVPRATKSFQPLHLYIRLQQVLNSQMARATSSNFLNPSFMMGQYMGQMTPNNREFIYQQRGYSPLTRFMQDPYCRAQLKGIVKGSMLKWAVEHGAYTNLNSSISVENNFGRAQGLSQEPYPALSAMWNMPPPPLATFLPGPSNAPPMSVPVALAQELQKFIYSTLSAAHAQLGFMVASPQQVGGGEEYGLGILGKINADDMYDAIMMLLDD